MNSSTSQPVCANGRTTTSTGDDSLDRMLDEATVEAQGMALACLQIDRANRGWADDIIAVLREQLRDLCGARLDEETAPAREWLSFASGFIGGCNGPCIIGERERMTPQEARHVQGLHIELKAFSAMSLEAQRLYFAVRGSNRALVVRDCPGLDLTPALHVSREVAREVCSKLAAEQHLRDNQVDEALVELRDAGLVRVDD